MKTLIASIAILSTLFACQRIERIPDQPEVRTTEPVATPQPATKIIPTPAPATPAPEPKATPTPVTPKATPVIPQATPVPTPPLSTAQPTPFPTPRKMLGTSLDRPAYDKKTGVAKPPVWLNKSGGKIKMKKP